MKTRIKNYELLDLADRIVCLSLEDDEDRRKLFYSRWEKYLEGKKFNFHLAARPTKDSLNRFIGNFNNSKLPDGDISKDCLGRWGCWLSHYEIISYCVSKNLSSILILEDDTLPNEEVINKSINPPPPDWDLIYLGYSSCDVLSEYRDQKSRTETTYKDPSSFYNYGGWKRIRAWGTFAMILKSTVFQDYLRELKDYAYENSVADNDPTADGTYYYYLWKKHSFYCNNEVVLHDYSLKSNINV